MSSYSNTLQNFIGAGVVILVSLILVFFVKIGWLAGIGTAAIYIAFVTLMIEGGFSKSRATLYTDYLQQHSVVSLPEDAEA